MNLRYPKPTKYEKFWQRKLQWKVCKQTWRARQRVICYDKRGENPKGSKNQTLNVSHLPSCYDVAPMWNTEDWQCAEFKHFGLECKLSCLLTINVRQSIYRNWKALIFNSARNVCQFYTHTKLHQWPIFNDNSRPSGQKPCPANTRRDDLWSR